MGQRLAQNESDAMPALVLIAVSWLTGLILAHHWLVPAGAHPLALAILAALPLTLIVLSRPERRLRLGLVCSLALVLGSLRYTLDAPDLRDPRNIAYYNDSGWIAVEGVVSSYPDVRDAWTYLNVRVEHIRTDELEHAVRGTLLVRTPRFPEYAYGDRLVISGVLQTPPEFEGFSYRAYLARKGIHSLIHYPRIAWLEGGQGSAFLDVMFSIKDRARDLIAAILPDPEAALLQGILLGLRSGIPAGLYDDYNRTGTSHVIVISGANIAVVTALVYQTLGRLVGKRRAFWFTMVGITLYVLLVGADDVVVRAGLMGALYVAARHLGRQATAYVSLFASAMVLTLFRPQSLWDVGFQLSFAATLGLALLTAPLERLLEQGLSRAIPAERAQRVIRALSDVLIVTIAAQTLTLPLIAYTMGRLSVVAPLTNLLILPVQPAIMSLGGSAVLLGLFPYLEPLARLVGFAPWLCLKYTNAVVRATATLPLAEVRTGPISAHWLIVYYAIVLGAVCLMRRRREYRIGLDGHTAHRRPLRALPFASAVTVIVGLVAVLQLPDGRLHVAFLDVGQGDAILITTPRGQQILVDGGPSPIELTSALGKEMPFWDRSLDLVVMTHPDADHVTGLPAVLERFTVGGWLDNGLGSNGAVFRQCEARLAQKGVPRRAVGAGTRLDLGRGLILDVLHPQPDPPRNPDPETNNNSLVLRLEWGGISILLTGDIEAEAELQILENGYPVQSNVLKVAHHGSASSTTAEFLEAVAPSVAVISVGAGNPSGLPSQDVLDRLTVRGNVSVLRTDEVGTVEITSDGKRLWVRTER